MAKSTPWLMLFSRITLFVAFQALLAMLAWLAGVPQAWDAAANWWLLTAAAVDLVVLLLLIRVFAAEGRRFWDLFRIEHTTIKGDLLVILGFVLLAAPVSYLPNVWLAQVLFGSPEAAQELIVRSLPTWAALLATVLFPIGQGLTELPTYFGYVMSRLQAQGMRRWLAIAIPVLVLALQHIAIPLLFDARFIAWRGLMLAPFAFLFANALFWRPRLMPYLVVVHVLSV